MNGNTVATMMLAIIFIVTLIALFIFLTSRRIKKGWIRDVVEEELSSTYRCPSCGALLYQKRKYCPECGRYLH